MAMLGLRSLLGLDDDLVVYGLKLVIPCSLQQKTLVCLHDGHQGVDCTKCWAWQSVFWSGINWYIENIVSRSVFLKR